MLSLGLKIYSTAIMGQMVQNYLLNWPLTHSLIPTRAEGKVSGFVNPTFTRASGVTFPDFEGLYHYATASNEAVFKGARRVKNLSSTADLSSVKWSKSNGTITVGKTDPDGGTTAFRLTATGASAIVNNNDGIVLTGALSKEFINSVWVRRVTGTGNIYIYSPNNNLDNITSVLTTSWQRFSGTVSNGYINSTAKLALLISSSGDAVDIWHPQLEEVTGQTNQNPSEYISTGALSAPYHGAGVDGVKYFNYENGNTVASNVVTEATGSAISAATLDGIQLEPASTNKFTGWSRLGEDKLGSELVTGTNSDMSGANNWDGTSLGAFNINSTVAGKMYILGDGGVDRIQLGNVLTSGKWYRVSLKARLNTGASTEIYIGSSVGTPVWSFGLTPTGTETTFTGEFLATTTTIYIGLNTGFNAIAFEIDDISIKEVGGTKISDGTIAPGLHAGVKSFYSSGWWNSIIGATVSGQSQAFLEIVDDTAKITSGNLLRIVADGKVYKADNSGGAAVFNVDLTGALSAAAHSLSVFARGASAADDDIKLRTDTVDGTAVDLTAEYVRYNATITAQASDKMRIEVPAGDTLYFILPQAEAQSVSTSPIIVEGAAATRAATSLTIPSVGNFSNTQGMVFVDWTPMWDSTEVPNGTQSAVLSVSDTITSLAYWQGASTFPQVYDGTTVATKSTTITKGTTYNGGVRWNSSTGKQEAAEGGTSGTEVNYDGAYTLGATFNVVYSGGQVGTNWIKNIRIYNIDKGTTFIETETTP